MGKFDAYPPLNSKKILVPEWAKKFGEVEVVEGDGVQAQKLIDLTREYQEHSSKAENISKGMDVEYYAKVFLVCGTVGGEKPPYEWMIKAPVRILKKLAETTLSFTRAAGGDKEDPGKN